MGDAQNILAYFFILSDGVFCSISVFYRMATLYYCIVYYIILTTEYYAACSTAWDSRNGIELVSVCVSVSSQVFDRTWIGKRVKGLH